MSEPRQVPGATTDNPERLQSRDAGSDWARLPEEETVPHLPGGGPAGTPTAMGFVNRPLAVVVAGFAVYFLTFFGGGAVTLVLGIVLILAGSGLSALRGRRQGATGGGTGPATYGG